MRSLGGSVERVDDLEPGPNDANPADQIVLTIPTLPVGQDPKNPQNRARVIMKDPEQPTQWNLFPRVVVARDSVTFAPERWHPITEEYRIEAPGSQQVTVPYWTKENPTGTKTGPTGNEVKVQAWPYDLTYTVECWHRFREWATHMVFQVMTRLEPYGSLFLTDSLGEVRSYDVFMESGPTDLTEVLSLTDRGVGYSLTWRVTGELDLEAPITQPTVRFPVGRVFPSPPAVNRVVNEGG